MDNYRDSKGKFIKGNPGGMNQKFISDRRNLIASYLSDDDVREIVDAQVIKAKRGNLASAKLLLSYAWGKPMESIAIQDDKSITIRVLHESDGLIVDSHVIDSLTPLGIASETARNEADERENDE